MLKRKLHPSMPVAKPRLRKGKRVKEGTFRLGISMMAIGLAIIAVSPIPLIASGRDAISVEQSKSNTPWQTELVLADSTPTFLQSQAAKSIEKAPSRYEEAEAAKRKPKLKPKVSVPVAKASESKPLVPTVTLAQATSCNSNVSDEEKWQWVSKAAAANNIPPQLLAAVWQIESGKQFCTTTRSSAGATGPMQFIPSTWNHYQVDGNGDGAANIHDARDALFGAARLLAANGANRGDYRKALYSYNHANWYVNKVIAQAGL